MKKKVKLPIIYVKWQDHCWIGNNREITDPKSIKSAKPYLIEEVGWLMSEDKEKIIFCTAIHEGFDGKVNGVDYVNATIILKTDIKEIKELDDSYRRTKLTPKTRE